MFNAESITTVSEEPERTNLDRFEANADKGNIISSTGERNFLRNLFVICEILSRSYSLFLRNQLANSLFLESVK